MVKKSTLAKKLASYTTLATVVLAATKESDGQVIYTKIDTTITTYGSYQLDISGPGAAYDLHVNTGSLSGIIVNSASINGGGGDSVNYYVTSKTPLHFVKPNVYKEAIDSNDKWTGSAIFGAFVSGTKGGSTEIAGKGDTYIGLRSVNGVHFYFGWLRVNLNAKADTLIIRGAGFNSTPGDSITAGKGDPNPVTGINHVTNAAAVLESLNPNPATTTATIIYTINVPGSITLELYDITGRKIETLLDNSNQSPGRYNLPVNVSNLSTGMYFYSLTVNGQTYTQKLAVTH